MAIVEIINVAIKLWCEMKLNYMRMFWSESFCRIYCQTWAIYFETFNDLFSTHTQSAAHDSPSGENFDLSASVSDKKLRFTLYAKTFENEFMNIKQKEGLWPKNLQITVVERIKYFNKTFFVLFSCRVLS